MSDEGVKSQRPNEAPNTTQQGGEVTFGRVHAITDVCLLVEDLPRSIEFYFNRLGFCINRQAEGFVEFFGAGVTLACWQAGHIAAHTGAISSSLGSNGVCLAVRLEDVSDVDLTYAALIANGVHFREPPDDYPWNARCAYFSGPDNELWEIYAWKEGGPQGDMINFNLPSGMNRTAT